MVALRREASLVDLCRGRAQAHPTRGYRFLGDGVSVSESLSYGDLDRDARRIAVGLRDRGVPRGARVLLVYPPGLELVRAFWGCLHAGAIAVPTPSPSGARPERNRARLAAIAADARADAILTCAALAPTLASLAAVIEPIAPIVSDTLDADPAAWRDPGVAGDDLAILQYTSGSTRDPRGVMLSHANLLHNLEMLRVFHLEQDHMVMLHWLPLHHDMGLIRGMMSPLHMGGDCVMMAPLDFAQRPLGWLRALTVHAATTTGAPNFAYELCARRAEGADLSAIDLGALRIAFCSAEPVREPTIDRFVRAFAPRGFRPAAFRPAYGLAEATVMVTGETGPGPQVLRVDERALREGRVVPGDHELVSCGRALGGQELVIAEDDGRRSPPDRVGEVWLRGPSVAHGYLGRAAESEAVFGAHLADGSGPFLRTGDLGWMSPAGDLHLIGRKTDLVVVRGENHPPHEIEATVEAAAPALRAGCSAVFGVPIEDEGTDGVVVVCEGGGAADVPAIRAALSEAHDLSIHAISFVAHGQVPKTASGKVQRQLARRMYLDGAFDARQTWTAPSRTPFPWPRFGELARTDGSPRDRLTAFLALLAEATATAHAVLSTLFGPAAAGALERLAPRVHHVGFLAPFGLSVAGVESALAASAFCHRARTFKSEIWARELALRLGRAVDVFIVQAERAAGFGVEVFVADLPAHELEVLTAEAAGSHVALALAPGASFAEARELVHAEGGREPSVMRDGPSTNLAIAARVLYIDVPAGTTTRRLELISAR